MCHKLDKMKSGKYFMTEQGKDFVRLFLIGLLMHC